MCSANASTHVHVQQGAFRKSPQDPTTIEHQQAASGDVYAMPQKGKKGKKGKKKEKEEELTEEEKAALYSTPDRKGQKAKSEGVSPSTQWGHYL